MFGLFRSLRCVAMDHIDFKSPLSSFQSLARATLKKATTEVDFNNILHTQLLHAQIPTVQNRLMALIYFLKLLGSVHLTAARKMLLKLTPEGYSFPSALKNVRGRMSYGKI
jgi:hypothetical protein